MAPATPTDRLRILFPLFGPLSSFMRRDVELLGGRHEVLVRRVETGREVLAAVRLLSGADCVFCWFGSVRYLPVLAAARALGKPSLVVTGGYDVADLPEIRYGNMRPGPLRTLGRVVFRLADLALCVSHSARVEAMTNAGVPPSKIRVIPNAFDGERIGADVPRAAKEPMVLTVSGVNEENLERKGLLAVARASRLLPDVPFVIAGGAEARARARLAEVGGPNLALPGYVGDEELDALFRRAAVYFQPSRHEAFGCSVAEAMLYNCIPVVSPRFGLPEVVGPCGLYVEPDDASATVAALRRALAGEVAMPETPRARIRREYPAGLRRAQLLEAVAEVTRRRA